MRKHNAFVNAKTKKIGVKVRMTKELHKKIATFARVRGISKNAAIVLTLDRHLGSSNANEREARP